jgi:CubicO group peptidase (beta-lactamase class C family)
MNTPSPRKLRKPCCPRLAINAIALLIAFAGALMAAAPAQARQPLQGWLLLGPMPVPTEGDAVPEKAVQKAFFEMDQLAPAEISGVKAGQGFPFGQARLLWSPAPAAEDGQVDLAEFYGNQEYASAYAYLEWTEASAREMILGAGSDDALRIWLNGELVHSYWGSRSLEPDQDILRLQLSAGLNRLLIKVQNQQYGWGFVLGELEQADLGERLVRRAGSGDAEAVETLLSLGVDPQYVGGYGLTAWQWARIRGKGNTMKALEKAGANTSIPMPAASLLADRYLSAVLGPDEPGMAVLVAHAGEIRYNKAFGLADTETQRALTPQSGFRIGSVTKQFTAAAILLLVQDGRLSLDDTLAAFYPQIPNAGRITLRQMLNHTAGIRSYTEQEPFLEKVTEYIPHEAMEELIAGMEPDFEPGTACQYSNSGYYLLGRIVEKVSGQPLGQFWEERFFAPLGMKRSAVYDNRLRIARPDEALGHSWQDGSYSRAVNWDMSWAGGAGNLYSTTDDLYRWNEGLYSGSVLNPALVELAQQPGKLNNGEQANLMGSAYGMGLMPERYRGLYTVWHSGGLHGYVSFLLRAPQEQITVVALHNAMPSNGPDPQEVAMRLTDFFFYEVLQEEQGFTLQEVDPALLPDYAGRYAYPGGGILNVRVEEQRLLAQLTGQNELELFPAGPDLFVWKVVDASIRFVRDAEGAVNGAEHSQGGRSFPVSKMAEEVALELPEELLGRYVGAYDLRGSEILIERKGKTLIARIAGQPDVELFARSQREFFLKVVQASITFQTDASGNATGLVLNQAGLTLEATRKP